MRALEAAACCGRSWAVDGGLIAPTDFNQTIFMEPIVDVAEQSVRCSCGPAFEGEPGEAYNEAAFRYLLEVERRRAERANRSVVLLLVNLRHRPRVGGPIPASVAPEVFSGLWASVREVDFIGWYRDQRVAGAVLTQQSGAPSRDACREIRQRVIRALANQLPAHLIEQVQVRVARLYRKRNN